MARVFDQGLNTPRGFVLANPALERPTRRDGAANAGSSAAASLFLMPGDSPLGLRLPISSLPYIPPENYPYINEQDPLAPREALPVFDRQTAAAGAPPQAVQEEQARRSSGGVRTAMSIEIRDGMLCAFMPPLEKLEDYLELVSAVEATAEEMQMPVHIEGYAPPTIRASKL